jgi:protein-disulfide isomerase
MSKAFDKVATILLVGVALLMAFVVVRREFFGGMRIGILEPAASEDVKDWQRLTAGANLIGVQGAPVQVVEFADFECPFCRQFHDVLDTLRRRFPNQIALWFIHDPLQGHRFANLAAHVSECASRQHSFAPMYDALYARQDSFGLVPWSSYAVAAGVVDTILFAKCLSDKGPVERIETGKKLAAELKVTGTPTVIINGRRYGATPYDSLAGIVEKILAQRK